MKRFLTAVCLGVAIIAGANDAKAAEFAFGEETKGATFTAGNLDMSVRIRSQARLDYGDTVKSEDGTTYETEADLYFRRLRLEVTGHFLKDFKYNVVLAGDKWEKAGNTNEVIVQNAFLEYKVNDFASVVFGKEKLPYSRVSLSSSARQLLIERPVSTEAAKKLFGPTDAYYQPKLAVRGKFSGGMVTYEAAIADGWQNGDDIGDFNVQSASPVLVGRVEFSPTGWVESSKSDAHMGSGQHLSAGLSVAKQGNIEYNGSTYGEDRTLWGADLSGHYKGITAQLEYINWTNDFSDPAEADTNPTGLYLQAGYFIDGPNVEPVVRHEIYDQDSNASDKDEKTTTVGVNWYGKGHSLKAGLNWVHTSYGSSASGRLTDADSKDVLQAQVQLYF